MSGQAQASNHESQMTTELARQAAAAHNSNSTILNLPGEIRNAIYNAYWDTLESFEIKGFGKLFDQAYAESSRSLKGKGFRKELCWASNPNFSKSQGLGQVCQQIRAEYMPLFRDRIAPVMVVVELRQFLGAFPEFNDPTSDNCIFVYDDQVLQLPAFRKLSGGVPHTEVSVPTVPSASPVSELAEMILDMVADRLQDNMEGWLGEKVQLYFTPDCIKAWWFRYKPLRERRLAIDRKIPELEEEEIVAWCSHHNASVQDSV